MKLALLDSPLSLQTKSLNGIGVMKKRSYMYEETNAETLVNNCVVNIASHRSVKSSTCSFWLLACCVQRDETLISQDKSLVSKDKILVSQEGGNF